MTYFPPAPEDWQGWQPPPTDPRFADPRSYQQPIPDGFGGDHSFAPQPALAFAPHSPGQGEIPPWLLAMAQSVQAHPLGEGMHANNALQAFTLGLANRGGDVGSRRVLNQYADSTGNPGNKLALARLNMQRVTQTMAAQKESDANLNRAADNARADKYFGLAGRRQTFAENKPGKGFTMSDLQKVDLPMSFLGKTVADLTPDQLSRIPKSGMEAVDVNALSPAAQEMFARLTLTTGQPVKFGMGGKAAAMSASIANRAAEMDPNADLGTTQATYGGKKSSIAVLTKNKAAVGAFRNTYLANSKILKSLIPNIPQTGTKWTNAPLRSLMAGAGSVALAQYDTAIQSVGNEAQRLISQPSLAGVFGEKSQEAARHLLDKNATGPQILGALDILDQESANRDSGFQKELDDLSRGISRSTAPNASGSARDFLKSKGIVP